MRITLALGLTLSIRLLAQTTLSAGAVAGTVRDESGSFVAGAKITLTEQAKGLVRESESDAMGSFCFRRLSLASIRCEWNARASAPNG
jgi:hypothetical protein